MENNKKLRQKCNEEIKCSSEVKKLKDDVGVMDVNKLISEKKEINAEADALQKEVIFYL